MGGEFRERGVLSGAGVCENNVWLRKAKRKKWDVVREWGYVGSL